jgi:hypothetical protein
VKEKRDGVCVYVYVGVLDGNLTAVKKKKTRIWMTTTDELLSPLSYAVLVSSLLFVCVYECVRGVGVSFKTKDDALCGCIGSYSFKCSF